jgi:uncharacterized RDD family membrane protein YckC
MSSQMPTQPPPGAGPPPGVGPSGPRANFGQRLGAYLIDVIIIVIPIVILVVVAKTAGYLIGIVISWAYFTYFEGGSSGQTLGKRALGIRIVDANSGGPIGYGRGFVRQIGRIISGLVCYLGYLWMLWDRERQTWHDKIATTVVVPVRDYPVS